MLRATILDMQFLSRSRILLVILLIHVFIVKFILFNFWHRSDHRSNILSNETLCGYSWCWGVFLCIDKDWTARVLPSCKFQRGLMQPRGVWAVIRLNKYLWSLPIIFLPRLLCDINRNICSFLNCLDTLWYCFSFLLFLFLGNPFLI